MRGNYPSLKGRSDAYVFSALCIKAHFYRNPAFLLYDEDIEEMIVDGAYDGGADFLLADPASQNGDIVIGQSKFYKSIKHDEVFNALVKMSAFYKDMADGHFENVNEHTQKRFLTLSAEAGSESRIIFFFCTSAPKNKISVQALESKFMALFGESSNIDLHILFASDIAAETREAESRRPTVESGEIIIDREGNILTYGNDAAIVNVSAMSAKKLYAMHGNNLLAKNLRYHITSSKSGTIGNVDKEIDATINEAPALFWMKNNGITIICDSFRAEGNRIILFNFSVINGGQTLYVMRRNKKLCEDYDFWLPCKIICVHGETEDEKNARILEIAKAVNSQKPIKPADLKANSPEQLRFVQAMRDEGIFYQTKRGEEPPKEYKLPYKNTDLAETGKLCLCAVFQMPGTGRSKPSTMYDQNYYDVIFGGDQSQTARICRELLYIYYYFQKTFIEEYDSKNSASPMAKDTITFARNSRTVCVAFVAFASRYVQENITEETVLCMKSAITSSSASERLRGLVSKLDGVKYILPKSISSQREYNRVLDELFTVIITFGYTVYDFEKSNDPTIRETNFLKDDRSYYKIISLQWPHIKERIKEIFSSINSPS